MKRRKIIGAKVRLTKDTRTKGGESFQKGEIGEIYSSHLGYSIKFPGNRAICRVHPSYVEFLDQ